jgi:hypothetical protein
MKDAIDVGIHIKRYLIGYLTLFENTETILYFRKNNKGIVLAFENNTNNVYFHNFLMGKKDIILKSYSAQKIIDSVNGNILGYIDNLVNRGYKLVQITK